MADRHVHRPLVSLAVLGLALGGCDLLPKRSPGETLYRDRCAECHGLDGSGNTARYMSDARADLLRSGRDAGAWEQVIRDGVFGRMPGNPDLTREQMKALIDYLRQLRGEAPPRRGGG